MDCLKNARQTNVTKAMTVGGVVSCVASTANVAQAAEYGSVAGPLNGEIGENGRGGSLLRTRLRTGFSRLRPEKQGTLGFYCSMFSIYLQKSFPFQPFSGAFPDHTNREFVAVTVRR